MNTPMPTSDEIAELVAFLPRLYADGFNPVKTWHGGTPNEEGVLTFPFPEYDDTVAAFYWTAARECWRDYGYRPEDAYRMLRDHETVRTADLTQIKTMLTYCVRGERFSDGHWAAMIEEGHIRRLLVRLAEIGGADV